MSNALLVSVIVAAYNCEKTIVETLNCLFEQDYKNIEIIVINDGSTDNTLDLLKTYGNKIQLIDQINGGAPSARNKGINVARGDLISFCDADDLWSTKKVIEQVSYLETHPNVGMVYCDWLEWHMGYDGRFVVPENFNSLTSNQEIDHSNSGWIYHKLLLDCICLTSTVMIRKKIVDKIGLFDVSLLSGEDYNYWLKVSLISEIHKLKAQMVLYRILPQSISRTPTSIHYEYMVLQRAISLWGVVSPNGDQNSPGLLKERFAKMRFGFGYLHLKSGDLDIAVKSFWDSILNKPLWYVPWVYLLFSLFKRFSKAIFTTA